MVSPKRSRPVLWRTDRAQSAGVGSPLYVGDVVYLFRVYAPLSSRH